MVNVVPSPSVLATWMSPPCACAMALVMVNPRPTPGMACLVAVDARKKRANRRSNSSAGIPTPVSLTQISARSPAAPSSAASARRVSATRPPAGVNFRALEMRLSTACARRTASPGTTRGSAVAASTMVTPLADAAGRALSNAACRTPFRSTGCSCTWNRPDSTWAVNSRSDTNRNSRLALRSMIAR